MTNIKSAYEWCFQRWRTGGFHWLPLTKTPQLKDNCLFSWVRQCACSTGSPGRNLALVEYLIEGFQHSNLNAAKFKVVLMAQTYPKDFVFLFYRMLLCTSYRWLGSLKCWENKENCYLPLLCFIAISLRLSKVNNPILYSRNTCRHCMGREFCGFVVFIAIIIFVTVYFHLQCHCHYHFHMTAKQGLSNYHMLT